MERRNFIQKALISIGASTLSYPVFASLSARKDKSGIMLPREGCISISGSKDYLLRDNKYFFYLADTIWSGFTNPTDEEWIYYLAFRKSQGFNALQINILPQGDRSVNTWENPLPFETDSTGKRNYDKINPEYFERASALSKMAVEQGFTLALVVLWGEFIPGTWINKSYKTQTMTKEQIKKYIDKIVDTFSPYNPIWIVSGDTDLPEQSLEYYKFARDYLKELTPDLLCTFHHSPNEPLPDEWTDIYFTYSGHQKDDQSGTYKQAIHRWNKKIKRPIINAEPCYEGLGSNKNYRFSEFDIRKALWQSLLSGAKAGFTYGSHGVWNWHRTGQTYYPEAVFGTPFDWRAALNLPAAWDAGYARNIFELYHLYELSPAQELLENCDENIRISAKSDHSVFAIYTPIAKDIEILLNLQDYDLRAVNLSERRFEFPPIQVKDGKSKIGMLQSNTDYIIIGRKSM